jgi:hypothetical protein
MIVDRCQVEVRKPEGGDIQELRKRKPDIKSFIGVAFAACSRSSRMNTQGVESKPGSNPSIKIDIKASVHRM